MDHLANVGSICGWLYDLVHWSDNLAGPEAAQIEQIEGLVFTDHRLRPSELASRPIMNTMPSAYVKHY